MVVFAGDTLFFKDFDLQRTSHPMDGFMKPSLADHGDGAGSFFSIRYGDDQTWVDPKWRVYFRRSPTSAILESHPKQCSTVKNGSPSKWPLTDDPAKCGHEDLGLSLLQGWIIDALLRVSKLNRSLLHGFSHAKREILGVEGMPV